MFAIRPWNFASAALPYSRYELLWNEWEEKEEEQEIKD